VQATYCAEKNLLIYSTTKQVKKHDKLVPFPVDYPRPSSGEYICKCVSCKQQKSLVSLSPNAEQQSVDKTSKKIEVDSSKDREDNGDVAIDDS